MLLHRVTPGASSPAYSDVVNTTENLDYIKDDALYRNQGTPTVMVTAETDLESDLLANYPAGTVAYTAGFADMWQKDASGEWVELGG